MNTNYFNCQNLHSTKVLIDSLKNYDINYTITPTNSISEKINEFSVVLYLGVNLSSKLFQNNDTLFSAWTPNAKKVLVRLFPELIIDDVSSQPNGNWGVRAPGHNLGNSGKDIYYFEHKQLRFVLSSSSPIKLDFSRLKNTDLFLDYYVQPMYIVTKYTSR